MARLMANPRRPRAASSNAEIAPRFDTLPDAARRLRGLVAACGGDHYADGKIYTETGAQSSPSRDAGLALSSLPEPTSAALVLIGMAGAAAVSRRRRAACAA